jgi:chromosome segregation ATPase
MPPSHVSHERSLRYVPKFFDIVSTLILGIIFLLTIFVIVQLSLKEKINNTDSLQTLNERITQLTESLSLEQAEKSQVEKQMAQLETALATTEGERDRYKAIYEDLGSRIVSVQDNVTKLAAELDAEKKGSQEALARITQLTENLADGQVEKSKIEKQEAQLKATLATTEGERDRYKALYDDLGSKIVSVQDKVTKLAGELEVEKKGSLAALAQIKQLTENLSLEQAEKSKVEQQEAQLKAAQATIEGERDRYKSRLQASEEREKEWQLKTVSLETQLSVALARECKN